MKRVLFISTFLFSSLACWAEYKPLKLYEMIIKAEKIVYGTIVEIDSNYFTLNIEGSLTSDSGTLKISKFRDWTCAARWTKYEVDQRVFLFLTTWKGELVTMSGGNEGELPILDNMVHIHSFSTPIPPPQPPPGVSLRDDLIYFETEHFDVYGGDFYGLQWNLHTFLETISFIRECFNFTYGKYRTLTDWQITCNKSELERVSQESKLVAWVNSEATRKDER